MLWNYNVAPDSEPRQIFIEKGIWHDPTRNDRAIPYKVYLPQESGADPWPLVVWSHGLGGSRDGAGFISRYIASHGYAVVHIQHEGTDSSLWEGKPGHPWDIIRAMHIPRKATLQRLRDVPFALDQMEKSLAGKIDMTRLGFSGHSFGAMTTQVMAGQYRCHGRRRYQLTEPRIKAGILYSSGPAKYTSQYEGIRIPLMTMTGTDDASPLGEFSAASRQDIFKYATGSDQYLLVLQDGDHMVFNGSRGKLGVNPKRDVHESIIKVLSLAFWEAYLNNNTAAAAWLTGEGVKDWLGDEATYMFRRASGVKA